MIHRRTGLGVLLALLAVAVSACGAGSSTTPTPLPPVPDVSGVSSEGRLEPVRFVELASGNDGLVSEVLVREGDQVEAGQIIARLDSTESQTLEEARAETAVELGRAYEAVRSAQSRLDGFPMPRIFVGMTAEHACRTWLAELDRARTEFEPYEATSRKTLKPNFFNPNMPRRVLIDTGEYDGVAKEYKKALDVAWMNYTKAVQWLQLDSELETAKARLSIAQSRSEALGQATPSEAATASWVVLADAEIRAPFRGVVTNLDIKVGEQVAAGEHVATLADTSAWIVRTTDLTEIDVVNVREGQRVEIGLDAVPGKNFEGSVLGIGSNYSERQGDVVYEAVIVLPQVDPAMRWGMTAAVDFVREP